jgi:hypothetical protein
VPSFEASEFKHVPPFAAGPESPSAISKGLLSGMWAALTTSLRRASNLQCQLPVQLQTINIERSQSSAMSESFTLVMRVIRK